MMSKWQRCKYFFRKCSKFSTSKNTVVNLEHFLLKIFTSLSFWHRRIGIPTMSFWNTPNINGLTKTKVGKILLFKNSPFQLKTWWSIRIIYWHFNYSYLRWIIYIYYDRTKNILNPNFVNLGILKWKSCLNLVPTVVNFIKYKFALVFLRNDITLC